MGSQVSLAEDILVAVDRHWTDKLSDVHVRVAYPDARTQTRDTIEYPAAAISIIGREEDPRRRFGGIVEMEEKNEAAGTAKLYQLPIPLTIQFQLDIEAKRQAELHRLDDVVMLQLYRAKRTAITTEAGRQIYLKPLPSGPGGVADVMDGDLWRSTQRFKVDAWLTTKEDVEQAYLIRQIDLDINEEEVSTTF